MRFFFWASIWVVLEIIKIQRNLLIRKDECMNELKIKKAGLEDTDESYSIISQCRDLLSEQGMDNWKRYTREKVEQIIKSDSMFILMKGNETIGTIKISEQTPSFYNAQDMENWENTQAKALYFTALAISPKYHGKGYGSVLLDYVEKYAREHEVGYLRMTMFSENLSLASYYTRKGFTFPQKRKVIELDLTLSFGEKRLY